MAGGYFPRTCIRLLSIGYTGFKASRKRILSGRLEIIRTTFDNLLLSCLHPAASTPVKRADSAPTGDPFHPRLRRLGGSSHLRRSTRRRGREVWGRASRLADR